MDGFGFFDKIEVSRAAIADISDKHETEAQLVIAEQMGQDAFRIRHDGYLSYGYITPKKNGLFFDKYDFRRNVRTVLIYRNGIPAATIRICLYDYEKKWEDADTIPAMEIFENEILDLRKTNALHEESNRIIEITRFARDPAFANDRSLLIAAFRVVAYLRLYFNAGIMINAVRPHHMPTYRRLGFQKIEEPRRYPNLTYSAGLMAMFSTDFEAALKKIGFPTGISIEDPVYSALINGNRVNIFENQVCISHMDRSTLARPNPILKAA